MVVADCEGVVGGINYHLAPVTDPRKGENGRYLTVRRERIEARTADADPQFGDIRILTPLRIRTATISAVETIPAFRNRLAFHRSP